MPHPPPSSVCLTLLCSSLHSATPCLSCQHSLTLHARPVLPDQASPRSSVRLRSTAHTASTGRLSYRLFLPGPYQPCAARRLVLQWASHLDAFSGSPSRP